MEKAAQLPGARSAACRSNRQAPLQAWGRVGTGVGRGVGVATGATAGGDVGVAAGAGARTPPVPPEHLLHHGDRERRESAHRRRQRCAPIHVQRQHSGKLCPLLVGAIARQDDEAAFSGRLVSNGPAARRRHLLGGHVGESASPERPAARPSRHCPPESYSSTVTHGRSRPDAAPSEEHDSSSSSAYTLTPNESAREPAGKSSVTCPSSDCTAVGVDVSRGAPPARASA